jgi:hypothetical protein
LGRDANGAATVKRSLAAPQKVKRRITIWPSNSIARYIPKRNVCVNACTLMFIAALFIIAKDPTADE